MVELFFQRVLYDTQVLPRWYLRELDDRNGQDSEIKAKVCKFCKEPQRVVVTRTALTDMGLIPVNKAGVLESVHEHVQSKRRVFTDVMDNRDVAYIIPECATEDVVLYVKVKFVKEEGSGVEKMVLISAHPPRRW
jgi:hypothetical protein